MRALPRPAGLTAAIVDAIPDWRAQAARFPASTLLEAADELHGDRVITDATWAPLAAEFSDTQLVELCFLVGHYEMLAMTLNSLGVPSQSHPPNACSAAAQPRWPTCFVQRWCRAAAGPIRRRASRGATNLKKTPL